MRAPHIRSLYALALLPLLACAGEDKDNSDFVGEPPDMAARYNVLIGGTSGCEGEETWLTGWAVGPLAVEGDASELSFDFGDDMSFLGSVSASWQFGFSGEVTFNEAKLDVYGYGTVSNEVNDNGAEQLVLDGGLEAEVDDDEFTTNNCTITGTFQAFEL